MKNKRIYILLTFLLVALTACGGGGGSTPTATAKTATLKLSTTGTPSANLAGVGITIILPIGVIPTLNSDGTVAATVVTVSGVAALNTTVTKFYTPANGATNGKLVLAVTSIVDAGFGIGEYATVVLTAATGTTPLQSDFDLHDFIPTAVPTGAYVTGLTPTISGYTLK